MFKIDRNTSNKLTKRIKGIVFTESLMLLLFPITVNAKESNITTPAKLALGCYAGSIIVLVGLGIVYAAFQIKKEKEMKNKKNKRYIKTINR